MNRAMLMTFATAATVLAARSPAPDPPGWTVYGDVIVEVVSPRDMQTGRPGVR